MTDKKSKKYIRKRSPRLDSFKIVSAMAPIKEVVEELDEELEVVAEETHEATSEECANGLVTIKTTEEIVQQTEDELREAYYQEQKISLVPKRGTIVTNPKERCNLPVSRRNAKISSSR